MTTPAAGDHLDLANMHVIPTPAPTVGARRHTRALTERQALGRRIRAHRIALGLSHRDVAAHTRTGKATVWYIDTAAKDVHTGTLIDVAAAVGLEVALVADFHLPLLDLTAAELDVLRRAAWSWADSAADDAIANGRPDDTDPRLRSALDKLTTSTEETDR